MQQQASSGDRSLQSRDEFSSRLSRNAKEQRRTSHIASGVVQHLSRYEQFAETGSRGKLFFLRGDDVENLVIGNVGVFRRAMTVYAIWEIWKKRNDSVFGRRMLCPRSVCRNAIEPCKVYWGANGMSSDGEWCGNDRASVFYKHVVGIFYIPPSPTPPSFPS